MSETINVGVASQSSTATNGVTQDVEVPLSRLEVAIIEQATQLDRMEAAIHSDHRQAQIAECFSYVVLLIILVFIFMTYDRVRE